MKATHRTVINGQVYNVGDDLPDYGSLRFIENKDNVVQIQGLFEDFSKLPTWCRAGSSAYFIDTQAVYIFDEANSEWLAQ